MNELFRVPWLIVLSFLLITSPALSKSMWDGEWDGQLSINIKPAGKPAPNAKPKKGKTFKCQQEIMISNKSVSKWFKCGKLSLELSLDLFLDDNGQLKDSSKIWTNPGPFVANAILHGDIYNFTGDTEFNDKLFTFKGGFKKRKNDPRENNRVKTSQPSTASTAVAKTAPVNVEKHEIAALEKKLAALKQKSARKEEYQKMRALLDQKLKEVQGQIQMLEQEYKDVLN